MLNNEEYLDSAINIYRTLECSVRMKSLLADQYLPDFTLDELEELRDEAFLKIQLHTSEHDEAFAQLKKELNLIGFYDHA
jgi:hypothetical protein